MTITVAMIAAIGPSLAGSKTPLTDRCPKTTPEARGLRSVECPAYWPPGKGADLKSAEFWDLDFTPGAPLCGAGKKEEIDIAGLISPSDVGCTYANGVRLLISVPGTPVECWESDQKRFMTGHFNDGLVCYFRPTGDEGKDEIKIVELEKLTRASDLFGLHLGMTRADVEQALNAQDARINASEGHEIRATLTDGKEVTAVFATRGNKMRALDVGATAGTEDDPYTPLKFRFGVPEAYWGTDKSPASGFWAGEPHIRLEFIPLHATADSGWRLRLIDLDQID